jgi:hypothetical protein
MGDVCPLRAVAEVKMCRPTSFSAGDGKLATIRRYGGKRQWRLPLPLRKHLLRPSLIAAKRDGRRERQGLRSFIALTQLFQ